jgi:hypothetical protein
VVSIESDESENRRPTSRIMSTLPKITVAYLIVSVTVRHMLNNGLSAANCKKMFQ